MLTDIWSAPRDNRIITEFCFFTFFLDSLLERTNYTRTTH